MGDLRDRDFVVDVDTKSEEKAGKKVSIHTYDADHAFANPSNPKYNKEYAAQAQKIAMDFIKREE